MSDLYNADVFASDAFKNATSIENNSGKSRKYLNAIDYKRLTTDTGIEKFKFEPDGEYTFSFLPFPITEAHPNYKTLKSQNIPIDWKLNIYLHSVPTDTGVQRFVCPSKTFGKPCPFCDEKRVLFNKEGGYDAHKDEIKKFNDTLRNYFLVYNHADEKIYVMEYAHFYFGELLERKLARSNGTQRQIILADPRENRHSLHFWVDPSKLKDSKGKAIIGPVNEMEFVNRADAIPKSVMDKVFPLDKYIVQYSYEEIQGFLDGTYFADNGSEEETTMSQFPSNYPPKEEVEATPVARVAPVVEQPATAEMSEREKRRLARMQQAQAAPSCPVPSGKFGVDTDKFDECEDCPIYEKCADKFQEDDSIPF